MKIFNSQNRALLGLSTGHFSVDLYAALLVPLYPLIVTKLGINLAIISSIIAIGHLVSSLLQPLFGFFADKLRHRIFMVWGLILSSIFIPLTIITKDVKIFILFLMLGMLGNAFFHPQVSALIKEFNQNNSKLSYAMGIFLGMGTIGYAIGPYVSTNIVKFFGETNLLYVSLFGIFSSIFMYFFVPKMPEKEFYNKENFFFIMKEILKNKACMFLTFISIIKSAVSISFGTYIPFLLQSKGAGINEIGLVVTMFFIAGGMATMTSSKIEKLIKTKGVIVISFVSILPLVYLFLKTIDTNKFLAYSLFVLIGYFILLSVGVILVQAQKLMPKYTGVVSGVMQGFSWGVGALFLSPLGFIAQHSSINVILILMGILAFFVGLYSLKYDFE